MRELFDRRTTAKRILVLRHSMNATIVDLRYHMKDVLLAIERGETVTVLYRGREKAKLVPIAPASLTASEATPRTKDQPLFGMWKDRDELADPTAYIRKVRGPRPVLAKASINKPKNSKKAG